MGMWGGEQGQIIKADLEINRELRTEGRRNSNSSEQGTQRYALTVHQFCMFQVNQCLGKVHVKGPSKDIRKIDW